MLTTDLCLESIRRDGRGLAEAAAGNFDAAVERCPGWSVSDLVWHIRQVHYFWATIAEERLADPEQVVRLMAADPVVPGEDGVGAAGGSALVEAEPGSSSSRSCVRQSVGSALTAGGMACREH
jgi:hypothetical protein